MFVCVCVCVCVVYTQQACQETSWEWPHCVIYYAGITLETESQNVVEGNGTRGLVCPFNDPEGSIYSYYRVCMYTIRITEVFIGNYSVSVTIIVQSSSTCMPL